MNNPSLSSLVSQSPSDNELTRRMRLHQSWWRAFVLNLEPGLHPKLGKQGQTIGSAILNGEKNLNNFINEDAVKAVQETLAEWKKLGGKGMINEDRLFNNLLSSQPLCFNFFGTLKYNLDIATELLQKFYPEIKEITNILFEFAPNATSNNDNSAHDVALEFLSNEGKNGLIGLEVKYTEPFSQKEYNKPEYKNIYHKSEAFTVEYEQLITKDFNQLFRNQLIVESARLNDIYDIVYSGVFCFEGDQNAISKGLAFQEKLKGGKTRFKIITYQQFIESLQALNISWDIRKWTMLLWARYCGVELSKAFL